VVHGDSSSRTAGVRRAGFVAGDADDGEAAAAVGAALAGAVFVAGAALTGAAFAGAAFVAGAALAGAVFVAGAAFTGAVFCVGAALTGAALTSAALTSAALTGAAFVAGAGFVAGAALTGAAFFGGTAFAGTTLADAGTKTFEREHEMSLANNARELLLQNERALARLHDGTYGICEHCGNPIGKLRLQAFPRATLCMSCKQLEERR